MTKLTPSTHTHTHTHTHSQVDQNAVLDSIVQCFQPRILSERASQGEQNNASFSSVAPSSEELRVCKDKGIVRIKRVSSYGCSTHFTMMACMHNTTAKHNKENKMQKFDSHTFSLIQTVHTHYAIAL